MVFIQKYDGKFWNQQLEEFTKKKKPRDLNDAQQFLEKISFGIYTRYLENTEWKRQVKRGELNIPQEIEFIDTILEIQKTQEYDGNFIINGVNNSSTLKSLDTITGLSLSELEKRMLPDDRTFKELKSGEYHGSNPDFGGFIKEGEKLKDILVKDNDFVLNAGYTHQDLAKPLFKIMNSVAMSGKHRLSTLYFSMDGNKYSVILTGFPMLQDSPFNDGISIPGTNFALRKLMSDEPIPEQSKEYFTRDDKFFSFCSLHPYLISRYGFYEGNVRLRINPEKIISFFYK